MSEEAVIESTAPQESPAPTAPVAPAEGGTPAAQKQTDQAPAETPAEPPAEPTPEQAAKREGRRIEKKLDKAYRERAEANALAEFRQRRIEELERASAPKQPIIGEPRLEDFTDVKEYAKAYAEFHTRAQFQQYQVMQQQQAAQQQQQKLAGAWIEKSTKGESKYDDFDEVVGDLKPTNPWAIAIMQAENGEDIAHYLGKNMKEAQRITALDPVAQIREIGRLEAKLLAEPPKPMLPSDAPTPIKTVGGSNSPSTKKLSEMTQDEFEKRRRAQIAARR